MIREYKSPNYNWRFDTVTGEFARWGKDLADDPPMSPYGPEILDLEISAGGDCLGNCAFCYKSNGGDKPTDNLGLSEFEVILNKMPDTLTQIAFGIMNLGTNPDFFNMMAVSRARGIIPNYTTHGLDLTEEYAKITADLCGAVAVSLVDAEKTFRAIELFTGAGMKQVNIHFMLSEQTWSRAAWLLEELRKRELNKKVNAVVFLHCKEKGRAKSTFSPLKDVAKYRTLINMAQSYEIGVGFDSCSAPMYLKTIEHSPQFKLLSMFAEPCESALFSSYINHRGEFYPCSFMEGEGDWKEGINVLTAPDFLKDVWFNPRINDWRKILLGSSVNCNCEVKAFCRSCPQYNVTACKSST